MRITRSELVKDQPEERKEAFDPEVRMMATFHRQNGRLRVAVKGASEVVLQASTHVLTSEGKQKLTEESRRDCQDRNTKMAADRLRFSRLRAKPLKALWINLMKTSR